jgi:hypothetical protein
MTPAIKSVYLLGLIGHELRYRITYFSVRAIMFDVKIERWLKWALSQFVERCQIGC